LVKKGDNNWKKKKERRGKERGKGIKCYIVKPKYFLFSEY